ncbi:MAG: 4Fe-4S dicluster domain-containing protein, partial [Firmicutes bacterium]|nr:4Fe-4S dicluster domain-containing protein [Bacillota bacterium]
MSVVTTVAGVVTREDLRRLLAGPAAEGRLRAPVRVAPEVVLFLPVRDPDGVPPGYVNSTVPPKGFFFPQSEKILSWRGRAWEPELVPPPGPEPVVLFGVRPCDLRALTVLEPVFGGPHPDPSWRRRRELTTVVGLGCTEPGPYCFCSAWGISPVAAPEADLMLVPLAPGAEEYLLAVQSARGAELLRRSGVEPRPPGADPAELLARCAGEAVARFRRAVDPTGLEAAAERLFDHPYWKELARRCLGCGICTFLCPTCHCFNIIDRTAPDGGGARYRCWDSCLFERFTLQASGHNPRPTRAERLRNRLLHKLSYHVTRYGLEGCTGCGRCVAACPANI